MTGGRGEGSNREDPREELRVRRTPVEPAPPPIFAPKVYTVGFGQKFHHVRWDGENPISELDDWGSRDHPPESS